MSTLSCDVIINAENSAVWLAAQLRFLAQDAPPAEKRTLRNLAIKVDEVVAGIQKLAAS